MTHTGWRVVKPQHNKKSHSLTPVDAMVVRVHTLLVLQHIKSGPKTLRSLHLPVPRNILIHCWVNRDTDLVVSCWSELCSNLQSPAVKRSNYSAKVPHVYNVLRRCRTRILIRIYTHPIVYRPCRTTDYTADNSADRTVSVFKPFWVGWTLPSLNLGMSIVDNRDVSTNFTTEWQTV